MAKGAGPSGRGKTTQSKMSDNVERGRGKEGDPLSRDEMLAIDVLGVRGLGQRKTSGRSLVAAESLGSGRKGGGGMEPGQADVEPGQATADSSNLDSSVEEGGGEGKEDEEEVQDGSGRLERGEEQLFSYFSPPRSTGSAHSSSVRCNMIDVTCCSCDVMYRERLEVAQEVLN